MRKKKMPYLDISAKYAIVFRRSLS